ncbi:MAG: FGGY-family carbohydrate kinase [Deltaproteobacteria bacterium]
MTFSEESALALGIDIGTSGVRAVLMNSNFDVVAHSSSLMSDFGPNHRSPVVWWKSLESALEQLRTEAPEQWRQVLGISVDGTSGTMLALNNEFEPIGDALMYNDPVENPDILEQIREHAPRESAAHGATSGLAKLMTLQELPGCHRVLHQADWVLGKFIGKYRWSDENNSLKTGYDPILREWPNWISQTKARRELLPDPKEPGQVTGEIDQKIADRFGLAKDIKIVSGTTDGCAAFLATGATEIGDGVTSLGSTLVVKILSDRPVFAPEYGIYSHRIGDQWLPGGASNTGGNVLTHFFSDEELSGHSRNIDPETQINLDYYPLLKAGERFPINDPVFPPRLEPRPPDDQTFLHGLLLGMSKVEALAYKRLKELGGPDLKSLRTVGGGSKNSVWTALRQKQIQVPMQNVASDQAAAGAARLAWKGLLSV